MHIAIDGPAGAGKSTVARLLARRLNYIYVDTGSMYRAVTLRALQSGVELEEGSALTELARRTAIDFVVGENAQRVLCDGEDVTEAIRSPQVSASVSKAAARPELRAVMVAKQRAVAQERDVVMDGRDIGEVVLPQADYKFFITADINTRSRRRQLEMTAQGYTVDQAEVKRDLEQRDNMDASRPVGALKLLPDSIVINTSDLSVDEVLEQILARMGLA
ncbi:MAG: (d)CMP kinase [Syntrophomonadaceae bacterium]|nr:(d)CMP kinase [Syntrophomonadaceae bacterium]